jgi:hypothetical protein
MTLIPKGQLIAVNFPAGAGGKMLQNCIGLSRHCALVHGESAAWQLAWTGPCTDEYYQTKLRHMLTSLPDPMGSDWLGHEFLTQDLFGIDHTGFIAESPVAPVVYQLAEKGIWVTTTAHNYDYVNERLTRYWPVIRYVDVVNNEQFAKTWLSIKNGNLAYDQAWNTLGRTPQDRCFEFDLDSCIYDTTAFVQQIGKLYDHLEFDDFKPQLLAQFHERYIKLHQ